MNLEAIWARAAEARPTVHAITNPVTVNDCANVILAAGGAPIMAQDEREAAEIQSRSDALVLNLGALHAQEAMLRAGREANACGHPVVLAPVGAGASFFRGELGRRLLHDVRCTAVRGNASEMRALALGSETTRGVEADARDRVTEGNLEAALAMLRAFSEKTGAVAVLTGETDLVVHGARAATVYGGDPMMGRVTGAGCMLTSLIGTLAGANPDDPFGAAVAAVAAMDVCGGLAGKRVREMQEGTASFRTRLNDAVSLLTPGQLAREARVTPR